jgi:hypothetical protein
MDQNYVVSIVLSCRNEQAWGCQCNLWLVYYTDLLCISSTTRIFIMWSLCIVRRRCRNWTRMNERKIRVTGVEVQLENFSLAFAAHSSFNFKEKSFSWWRSCELGKLEKNSPVGTLTGVTLIFMIFMQTAMHILYNKDFLSWHLENFDSSTWLPIGKHNLLAIYKVNESPSSPPWRRHCW